MLGSVVHSPQFAYCWYRDAVQRYEETGWLFSPTFREEVFSETQQA